MAWLRGPGRLMGAFLLVALLGPALAPWLSAVIDRGPDGSARLSLFPIAIAAFDPFVWACARNSVAVASAVATGSLLIGVGLALLVGRRRFWGRTLLWSLAMAPLAAGPLLIAPGVALFLGGGRGWDWLAARSILGFSAEEVGRWLALIWVGLASGVPLVALATEAAFQQVDTSWSEAAKAAGASRWRVWREITWPILRPNSARAVATVFTLALVEPAGPLVLGLRRTLAVQTLDAAIRLDEPTRAATLALLAIAIAAVGRVAIGWWGRPFHAQYNVSEVVRMTSMSFRQAAGSLMILGVWLLFAIGPVFVLLTRALGAGREATPGSWSDLVKGWLVDPETRTWAANSSMTAALAIAVDLVIFGTLCRRGPGPTRGPVRQAARLFEALPPLALGVGALATPWLLLVLADSTGGLLGRWLRAIALELSPARSPGFLLVICLAAGRLPLLARIADLASRENPPVRLDAVKMMGASDRRARTVVENRWLGVVPARQALLALALAATNLVPALLLTPFSERRTLAPAVLGLVLEGEPVDPRAAGPIAAILAINVVALAVASRGREGSIGDWFRG